MNFFDQNSAPAIPGNLSNYHELCMQGQADFFSSGPGVWTNSLRQKGFWNPQMETCRHTKNFNSKLVVSHRSLYVQRGTPLRE